MAIQLSPAVTIREIDLTNVVPAVATSIGAAAIEATWGPVQDVTTVDSENELVQRFGKPKDLNAANWMAAANFLAYSNDLKVVRTDTTLQRNAVSLLTNSITSVPLSTGGTGYITAPAITIPAPPVAGTIPVIAVTNGGTAYANGASVALVFTGGGGTGLAATAEIAGGIVLSVTVSNAGSGYTSAPTVTNPAGGTGAVFAPVVSTGGIQATATATLTADSVTSILITNPGSGYYAAPVATIAAGPGVGATLGTVTVAAGGVKINSESHYTVTFANGEAVVGEFAAKYPGELGNSIRVSMADNASFATWAYRDQFDSAPTTSSYATANGGTGDELHIVVVDTNGKWTGTAGTVLERFAFVSKASDARKEDGSGAYYKTVLNEQSDYVWWMDHPAAATNWNSTATSTAFSSIGSTAITRDLVGGVDHLIATTGQRINAFDLFTNDEELDINLVVAGKANLTVANWIVQNLVEARKDCVAFISPEHISSGSVLVGNNSDVAEHILDYRNGLPSSSYMVLDSGYKYQYDRYNDKYRWVPLNGDIAGLCARTDYTDDPWFSPAGLNRGGIKNVVKLAYSPRKTDRDTLYKSGVNPVVSFPGQGVILFGDKTGLTKPSAFDRINVRRLFIVLEKAIATAAKYQLFELNDTQTRAQFRATIEPFLRDVKGRRGVYDFKVICDETNNTPQVIDSNRFAASIYLQPARSINFIELSFIATRTGVSFSEIAGSV
jgi:phage tail sheath protein FI